MGKIKTQRKMQTNVAYDIYFPSYQNEKREIKYMLKMKPSDLIAFKQSQAADDRIQQTPYATAQWTTHSRRVQACECIV